MKVIRMWMMIDNVNRRTVTVIQATPHWVKYSVVWVATLSTHILAIRQLNGGLYQDFGLDDISVCEVECVDFMTDAMDFGIIGTSISGNTYNFCLSPNIGPSDIIQWDIDCDGVPDAPVSTSSNCATFQLSPANTQICATVTHVTPDGDTCRVKLNACLPELAPPDSCTCDDFQSDVDAGFTRVENPPATMTFTPVSLQDCDQVVWHWGDGSQSSASVGNSTITHVYPGPGTYYICMQVIRTLPDGTVCGTREYCEGITDVAEIQGQTPGLTVQPNPNAGLVTVFTPENLNLEESFLRLTTPEGRLVQVIPVESIEMQLNLQQLPAGLYILSLYNGHGNAICQPVKLVKQ